jgi:apolipoprotein N-acyltransferase
LKSVVHSPWTASLTTAVMLYLTGPLFNLWFLALIALVPVVLVAVSGTAVWKRPVYLAFFAFYLVSLQGLRHAHPLMIFPVLAMAAYLAIYPLLFVGMLRNIATRSADNVCLAVIAATLWVGGEWVRNYFATGISVLMLGHSLAGMSHPTLIQIADCFGTYGISFMLVIVNVAVADLLMWRFSESRGQSSRWKYSLPLALLVLLTAHGYGVFTINVPTVPSETRFLLIGRDEQTEYQQDLQREMAIFNAYTMQTIAAVNQADTPIDVIVWPESMLSGGRPWYIAEENLAVPEDLKNSAENPNVTAAQLREMIGEMQADFVSRNQDLLGAISTSDGSKAPSIIGGCGIVKYGERAQQFSGVIDVGPDGSVRNTYAKNHLVMFGEYIPLIKSIPILKNYVPPGLGLDAGHEPAIFEIGETKVLPNLCIETAVERIAVDQMRTIWRRDPESLPNVIVTLTNDAWFDHTAVIEHHLRCAQMVAIGCRRPILSSANGGPTAWIDSSGRVIEKLPLDAAGEIMAQPHIDNRLSLYVRYGSLPAMLMAFAWVWNLVSWRRSVKRTVPTIP